MITLARWLIARRMAHAPLRALTTTAGIALGVAVVVAIQLTNASSLRGFEAALNTVSGRASLEVVGTGIGLAEDQLSSLGWIREYGEFAPIVEGDVRWTSPDGPTETLRVLGVDALRDSAFRDYALSTQNGGAGVPAPDARSWPGAARDALATGDVSPQALLGLLVDTRAIIVAEKFAKPHGLDVGSTLDVRSGDRRVALTIRALLKDEGPARVLDGRFILMDIASAQELLARAGTIDRLDVRVASSTRLDEVESALAARLPDGLQVQRPSQRGRQVEQMLAAFHLNLTALSYIALLVGLFLVYNTVSVAVLERRQEIGILRALGTPRRTIRHLFLLEAGLMALAGCLAGIVAGRVLATATVALTSTTVSALYIAAAAAPPALSANVVALAFATGLPLSLLAALVPAREAAALDPLAAIRGLAAADARHHQQRRSFIGAVILLALGGWCAMRPAVQGLPLFGYASAVCVVLGASLLVPMALALLTRGLDRVARHTLPLEWWLAVTNVGAAIPRLSISVAALAVSLSMMVAIAVMVGSFRDTVVYWVSQTLQADLFIAASPRGPGANDTLSPEAIAIIAADPSVDAIDRFRLSEVPYRDTRIRIGMGDFAVLRSRGSLLFKTPVDGGAAITRAIGADAALVSEAFAIKHQASLGDTVLLPTKAGPRPFLIEGVYYDYSSDRGVVMMDRATFVRHFGEAAPGGLSVYLTPDARAEIVRERLLRALGDDRSVLINTNASLRAEVLRIFDSTFAITYALEVIAILVAMLGVAGTLVTLMLERADELTTLRLLGAGRARVRRLIVGEAALIGLVAQGLGLFVGSALSLLLIYVVNVQSFGWTIQFHLPVAFLTQSTIAIIVATAVAGLYPARRAGRLALGGPS